MSDVRDVIVVGAGPGGSATAYFLARHGFNVLLLDKADFPRDKTCGDGLTPRALGVLRTMGLLDAFVAAGFKVNGVHIYAPNGHRVSSPIPPWGNLPPFALVLPRLQLDDLIRAHAVSAGAEFWPHAEVTDVLRDGGRIVGVRAKTADGPRELQGRYTVLATGASIALLERAQLLASPALFGRAARAYYEGIGALSDYIEFHFESVPLPGYGWMFPISPTAANVGAGYFVRPGQPALRNSPRQVLDEFIANPIVAGRLEGARPLGPVKGYPLRLDFPTARIAFPGLVLVGEAAGLVNPLTGEGIDYALESAEVGAEVLAHALRGSQAPQQTERRYGQMMRDRFLRAFVAITRVRDVYFRPWLLNRFASAANRNEDLKLLLIQIALGNVDPAQGLSPKTVLQIALG
ncbi:MAG: NAD(P)/FAD-dependent oxidoreductase [Anaerolineales bacterium]